MDPYEFKKDECVWGKQIGKGNFGEVYEVEYHGKKYAGKIVPKLKLLTEEDVKYMKGEIEILKKMSNCENSVKLFFNYNNENGDEILILELCDCELAELLNKSKTGFDSALIKDIMIGLNNAFSYMNQSEIIHRDIKLENIMLKYTDSSKKKFIPKINDYGISRTLQNGIASTFCGSPLYMAPEVILKKPYSDKADLWSIGILIYMMHFKEIPFRPTVNFCYDIKEEDVKKMFDKKKAKNAQDKELDDLMDKLLIYNPDQRISWIDYLNHPFFNRKTEDKQENRGKIIKLYDYILEKMVIYNYIEKEYLESLKKKNPNFKIDSISINDSLTDENGEYFILGVLAKYLEKIGVSVVIEKGDKSKNVEELNYSKTILHFICNGYIYKKRYVFDFELDNKRIRQLVLDEIERSMFNEKLRNKLLKEYNLNDEELIITNYKNNKNCYSSIVVFKSDFNKDFTKDELLKIFSDDDELKTLSNITKELVIPYVKLYKLMLEPSQDNNDDSKWGENETRGGKPYNPPKGWHKYGLKVFNRYDNKNNAWLGCGGHSGEWCVGYCPITGINKKIDQTYENDEDSYHRDKKVGIGVYCTSKPETMEEITDEININGTNYKVGFMIRLKPDKIRCPKTKDDIWVVSGNEDEFRPYGILIKKK